MSAQHTPEPWQVGKPSPGDDHLNVLSHGSCICRVNGPPDHPKTQAHAGLIAAAPELLEALQGLVPVCGGLDHSATREGLRNCDAIAKARAAMRKATRQEATK